MIRGKDHNKLWGTGPGRIYWWQAPVSPARSASVGRDMLIALIVWAVFFIIFWTVVDLLLAATG